MKIFHFEWHFLWLNPIIFKSSPKRL